MALTVSYQVSLTITDGATSVTGVRPSTSATASGTEFIANAQTVGTVAEALVLGDIATIGPTLVRNTDATNYVEVDSADTMDKFPQKIPAGGAILLAPQTATIYAKANTAPCIVQVVAVEL